VTNHQGSTAPTAGARVMSADGKQVGMVKEIRADRFLVDVRFAPDYWLGTETVGNVEEDLVQLIITKGAIGAAKLHDSVGPDGTGHADDFGGPAPSNRPPPSI
jgi:hypothetical protein